MSSITPITIGPDWTDLYAATGITVGTPLLIYSTGADVRVAVSATKPTGAVGTKIPFNSEGKVDGSQPGAWVSSSGAEATLYVQEDGSGAVRLTPFSDPRVIDGTKAFTFQPFSELNVKKGVEFYLRIAWPNGNDITAGATKKIHFLTGSKTVLAKLRIVEYVGEEFRINVYKNPTGVTGGTPVIVSNWNGQNPVATTVTVTRDVSTTDDGEQIEEPEFVFGASATAGRDLNAIPQGRERVLEKNTGYIVAITNTSNSASRFQYFLDFYEGEISTNIP